MSAACTPTVDMPTILVMPCQPALYTPAIATPAAVTPHPMPCHAVTQLYTPCIQPARRYSCVSSRVGHGRARQERELPGVQAARGGVRVRPLQLPRVLQGVRDEGRHGRAVRKNSIACLPMRRLYEKIQPRKHALDVAEYTAPTRQHDWRLDHTSTDQGCIFSKRSRS